MKKTILISLLVLFIFAGCKKSKDEVPLKRRSFLGLKTEYFSDDLITFYTKTDFGRLNKEGEFEPLAPIGNDVLKCAYNISTAMDDNHDIYYVYLTHDDPYSSTVSNKKIYSIDATKGNLMNILSITVRGNIFDMRYNNANNKLYCMVLDTTYTNSGSIPIRQFYLAEVNVSNGAITPISDMFANAEYNSMDQGLCINETQSYAYITYTNSLPLGRQLKIVKYNLNSQLVEDTMKVMLTGELNYYRLLGYDPWNDKFHISCIHSGGPNSGLISKHSIDNTLTIQQVIYPSAGGQMGISFSRNEPCMYGFQNYTCYPSEGFYSYVPDPYIITEYDFDRNVETKWNYKLPAKTMYFGLIPE